MDFKEREEIFAKEVLNLDDISKLFDICKSMASIKLGDIKRQLGKDRIKIQGKIHILDYLEWCDIQEKHMGRYHTATHNDHKTDPTGFFSRGNFF